MADVISGYGLSRRFINQAFVLAAHAWLVVEVGLNESQCFLADRFAFIQIRTNPTVEVFHHRTTTVSSLQYQENRIFYFVVFLADQLLKRRGLLAIVASVQTISCRVKI